MSRFCRSVPSVVLAGVAAALVLSVAGCCSTASVAVAPPPYQSDEVPISVYLLNPDSPSPTVVVVPNSAYLVAGSQTPHWLPGNVGDVTEVDFKGANPFERPVPCKSGHCQPERPPTKRGTFPYSVTIRYNGRDFKIDPRLIIGG